MYRLSIHLSGGQTIELDVESYTVRPAEFDAAGQLIAPMSFEYEPVGEDQLEIAFLQLLHVSAIVPQLLTGAEE